MFKISFIAFFSFFVLAFFSCYGQRTTNIICKSKFKQARDLIYDNPDLHRQSLLDSALNLTNECLKCDSIKKAVIDFKITLLITMKKYAEGISFIDSLKESDFTFNYKKEMLSQNFQALIYASKNDTLQRNLTYARMSADMEKYINKQNIKGREFEEIYIELFTIKGHFMNVNQINQEIDSLKKQYPNKNDFFNFFIK